MPEDFNSNSEHTVVFLVAPGDVLDERWLIEARIGQGAMGSVFRGKDNKLDRPVAIKILAPEHCRKPKVLARFEREAQLMTTLRHPNIIQLFGVGRRGALPYIAMQLLEGMTLSDVLKRKGGRLTPGETMAIVKQIAAGLSFIHHHGLVHRDIKPQNIFVGPGGRVTILDLGVVRDKSNPGLTRPGAMVGTPYYMSPEQIQGTDEIDKRTDVYALAAMTFELLIGRPPFLGNTNFEVLHAHRYQPVPDASTLSKAVNKDVARAIATAMSKKREDRPLSASEFSADLEAFFGSTEKVDPAVAFAFLEEEAEKERKAARDKAANKERVRSTRANTIPLTRIPVEATDPNEQAVAGPERQRKSGPQTGPNRPLSSSSSGNLRPSGDVPMARSTDFQLLESVSKEHEITGKVPARTDDEEEQDVPERGPSDTFAGAEPPEADMGEATDTIAGHQTDLREKNHGAQDTSDEDRGMTDPGEKSDPGATVTETGELRIVTTLKGLTTSAALFVDGRPEGNTPRSVQVPVGKHLVRVERQGFKAVEKQAVVSAGAVSLVRVELGGQKP